MRRESRRYAIKQALKVGAYSAPIILNAAHVPPVAAASPPPTPMVSFTPMGANEIVRGTGFPPSSIFYIVAYDSAGAVLGLGTFPRVVSTDATGGFTLTLGFASYFPRQGSVVATVNGGVIFVPYDNVQ